MKVIFSLSVIFLLGVIFANNRSKKPEIKIGDKAPQFTLVSDENKKVSLSDFKGQRVVLYFFPKADTPGWTKEACGFRNIFDDYRKAKIVVLGVSYDSPKSLDSFKKKYSLPFILLSDKNKEVAKAYGAAGAMWPKRITFLIDKDGTIKKIYKKINDNTHAAEILDDIS